MNKKERKEKEWITRGAERVWYWSYMSIAILIIFGLVYVLLTN